MNAKRSATIYFLTADAKIAHDLLQKKLSEDSIQLTKISEAFKSGNEKLLKELVDKAMKKLTDDLTDEFFLKREHEKYEEYLEKTVQKRRYKKKDS